ncbi:hypothetical protein ACFLUX_00660 [Chloroflexota bacterium]
MGGRICWDDNAGIGYFFLGPPSMPLSPIVLPPFSWTYLIANPPANIATCMPITHR